MSKLYSSSKWYQQKRWIFGSLLLCPPLGIPLLWLTRWPCAAKIGGSVFSGVLLLSMLIGDASGPVATAEMKQPALVATESPFSVAPTTEALEDALSESVVVTEELAAAESSTDWERVVDGWQQVLLSLEEIPISSKDYSQAQEKITEYQLNYDYAIAQQATVESVESEERAQQQAEEDQAITQHQATEIAQQQVTETVMPLVVAQGSSYVDGTCKELRARGVGSNFRPGDANYTSARDRDGDGIACES